LREAFDSARRDEPSAARIDAMVRAVERSTGAAPAASFEPLGSAPRTPAWFDSGTAKFVAMVVVSAGLAWSAQWALRTTTPAAETSAAERSPVERSVAEPSPVEPSVAEPSPVEPSVAEPSPAEPSVAEPSAAEPSAAEPSVAGPASAATPPRSTPQTPAQLSVAQRNEARDARLAAPARHGPETSASSAGEHKRAGQRPSRTHATSRATAQRDAAPRTPALSASAPVAARSVVPGPGASVTHLGELELLEAAQQALRESPKRALGLTEQHRRDYPKGAFVQEREQIAIEALFGAGRFAAMRARAVEFRRSFPGSAHSIRIDELLRGQP
jgi:hypothetical protein